MRTLMDKLTAARPLHQRGIPGGTHTEQDLLHSLHRDLSELLNSRRSLLVHIEELPACVRDSILAYGLPEFDPISRVGIADGRSLKQTIESLIQRFEPRLSQLEVHVVETASGHGRVDLQIHAMLQSPHASKKVIIETHIDTDQQLCTIQINDR
jgi:type VI secretion system protein ImpF